MKHHVIFSLFLIVFLPLYAHSTTMPTLSTAQKIVDNEPSRFRALLEKSATKPPTDTTLTTIVTEREKKAVSAATLASISTILATIAFIVLTSTAWVLGFIFSVGAIIFAIRSLIFGKKTPSKKAKAARIVSRIILSLYALLLLFILLLIIAFSNSSFG